MKVKVSDLIAESLERLDVRHAFGIIGAGNVHLFEAIARRGYTEIVCVHHEQAACMAMQTYYRTHGRLAASLLTTGGGSTNGVTGVVSAWMDSIPGLVIAGNEPSRHTTRDNKLRIWGTQGYDSVDMVTNVTKYSSRVMDPLMAIMELEKAAFIARNKRPGPCWIEIPMNIQSAMVELGDVASFVEPMVENAPAAQLEESVASVIEQLRVATRPIIWLGHGIRLAGAVQKVPELLELLGVPALVSWAGIDMVDSDHPLVFGRAGLYGQRAANFVLQNSNYVLAIGTRLAIPQIGYELNELAREAKIDVVDIDPLESSKHSSRTRLQVTCDAGDFINVLVAKLKATQLEPKKEWIHQCGSYRQSFPWIGPEHDDKDGFMNSYRFMERLNKFLKPNQVVVTDMGTALLCSHQVLKIKPGQRLMTSTGLGEMGYGLPGAIGVSFAQGRGEVMCLNCDGGMMMNLQELQTVVHHQLPIKLFIFNNDGYLMIKHTQNALFKNGYFGTDKKSGVSCPDFSKLAIAFDIPAYQIRNWDECDDVLAKVQATKGPVICEVFMHPEQPFLPKLATAIKSDGTLVSPPLEDLSPLLPREQLQAAMLVGLHAKSKELG
jgi:acetolactate synthase I/II/III large subunit